ncbi:MAG: DMT family transporter [Dehalococcoidia bacterium]
MKLSQFAVLLALGLTWGSSYLFIKVLVDDIDPILVVGGRILFGVLVLVSIVRVRGLPLPRRRATYGWLFFMGTLGTATPFFLISWSEEYIDSGTAAVLNSTVPLFVAILSIWFLSDEYLSPAKILGLCVGFAGVAVLSGGDLLNFDRDALFGDALMLIASLSYGLAAIVARRHLRGDHPISLAACQFSFALVIMTPLVLLFEPPTEAAHLSVKEWGAWLALGFAGTGLAYWAYYWLIGEVGAVRTTMVTFILPAVGVFLGWLALDEDLGWNALAGLVLILAGIALVMELAVSRRWRRPLLNNYGSRRGTVSAAEPAAD